MHYLLYDYEWTTKQAILSVSVLSQIGTITATSAIIPYINKRSDAILSMITPFLARISSNVVANSGLAHSLIQNFDMYVSGSNVSISGAVVNAFTQVESEELINLEKHTLSINHLTIYDCSKESLFIIKYFPNIQSLTLVGDIEATIELSEIPNLQRLKLVNQFGEWPKLNSSHELDELELWLDSHLAEWWEVFEQLKNMKKLKRFTVYTNTAESVPDLEMLKLAIPNSIEHFHIISMDSAPNIAKFSRISQSLGIKTLEISTKSEQIERIYGIEEFVDVIDTVIINVPKIAILTKQTAEDIKMLFSVKVELNEGLHIDIYS